MSSLREQFEKETGHRAILIGDIPSKGYVEWLESKLSNQTPTPDQWIVLFNRMGKFSLDKFPNATPEHHLVKLQHEIIEVSESPEDITEYADCLLALIGAMFRAGITAENILKSANNKMDINDKRVWEKLPDGTYQHIDAEHSPEVMANVTEAKETEPNQLRQLLIDRGTDFHENYHLNLRAKGKYGMGNVLRDLVKFMANLAVSINQTPKPVTPCNGLKSSAEILSELSGYEVKELKERQTEPIIQPIDALEAMQLYADQQRGVVTDEEIRKESDNLDTGTFGYYTNHSVHQRIGFIKGAKWMRSKLLTP